MALIVSTLVMSRQLNYVMQKDLGFEGDQVVVVNTAMVGFSNALRALEHFRNTVLPQEAVVDIARTGYAFSQSYDMTGWQDASGKPFEAHMISGDFNYVEMLGMEIVAGRDFSEDTPTDSTSGVLVNEAFVQAYEIENPVGYRLDGFTNFFDEAPSIIGVVRDFHFQSLHNEIAPAVININPNYYGGLQALLVKIRPDNVPATIALLEASWKQLFPDRPFNYSFLDENMDALYQTEQRWSRIVLYASLFAIAIACLGLFGLATLAVSRRTKEIGVRKVLGASVPGIALLVVREFAVLVGLATLVAWPLAYYGMDQWLAGFAYRVGLDWWMFVGAGLLTLIIAITAILYHALRAATSNPVDALRYE